MNTAVVEKGTPKKSFVKVDLGKVKPVLLSMEVVQVDPHQSRTYFDEDDIADLAESMDGEGQKDFIEVAPPNEDGMHIIGGGENRYRASILKKKTHIWAIIDPRLADPLDRQLSGLTSNIYRSPMIPLDFANEIAKQMKARGMDVKEFSAFSRIKVAKINRHLKLTRMLQRVAMCTRPDAQEEYRISFDTALLICDNIDYDVQWKFLEEAARIAETRRRIKPNMRPGVSRKIVLEHIESFNRERGKEVKSGIQRQNSSNSPQEGRDAGDDEATKLIALIETALPLGKAIERVFDCASSSTIMTFYNRMSSAERRQLTQALQETIDQQALIDVFFKHVESSTTPGIATSLTSKKRADYRKTLELIIQLRAIMVG